MAGLVSTYFAVIMPGFQMLFAITGYIAGRQVLYI